MRKEKEIHRPASDYKLLSGLFFRLLPYQILLLLISAVNIIVDSLFASNMIGKEAMGAMGLFAPMNHFLYALSIMLVSGSQLLYGKYIARDQKGVQGVFSVDLVFSTIISVITSAVMILFATTNLSSIIHADPATKEMFNQYLIGQAIGIPALVLGQQLFAFLSLENQIKRTTVASVLGFASNMIFDYLFIAVIPMSAFGLGLASSLSEWLFFAVQFIHYLQKRSPLRLSVRACNWKDLPNIIKRGYSGALSRFVEMFRCLIVNALILKCVGDIGLSSFAASNAFMAIMWTIPFGMVAVSRMLFSISVGEEDRRSIVDIMRVVFKKCIPIICVVAVIIALLAEPITQLFYRNPSDEVYHMTMMGFRMLPFCMPLAVISLVFACYTQAAEKKLLSVVLPVTDGFLGVTCLSLFLIPALKMNGLYLANILNGVVCFIVVWCFAKKDVRHRPENIEDLMAVPEKIGVEEDARLDLTVRSREEVVNVSRQVIAFSKSRGIDRRRSVFSGLVLEEMSGNIVDHGFAKDNKKNHSVDIRVVQKDNGIILRMRDNCVPFDPFERVKVFYKEDIMKGVGIRLAFRIAEEVQYQNLLGLNVLLIKL